MRTTIRIDEQLLKEAKLQAARSGKSLTEMIEDALREALSRRNSASSRQPVHLVTVNGKGLFPGVDLDDSASLLDIMENPRDPG